MRTLPKSIALSHCALNLSLQVGRRSVVGRFILLVQNEAPLTPTNLAVADAFIVRKIKVFHSHYCSPSGIPPGEINFHFFSPYSGWQKLITGFIMPFSSPTSTLVLATYESLCWNICSPPASKPILALYSTSLKISPKFRFWSSQTVAWAFK